ncbi:15522_t:CDS:1, partial [Racocetra persica]
EGHIKKDCKELKDSIEAKRLFRKARSKIKREKTQKSETTKISFSPSNLYKTNIEE